MHVYPVKEDTKKQIQNLLSAKKDDLSNFNHREKNDLVLFLMEQNAPSEDIIEVINSGANQDVTVFNSVNPALSYGNLLDLSFELLTKNIDMNHFYIVQALINAGAKSKNQDSMLTKLNELIDNDYKNVFSVRQNLINLESLIKDPDNKRYKEKSLFGSMVDAMPVFPVSEETQKHLIKLVAGTNRDVSLPNFSQKDKDDYLLFLLEKGEDFAGIYNTILVGGNKNLEVMANGSSKPLNLIDLAVALLDTDLKHERLLQVHALIKSGAEFKDKESALKVLNNVIERYKSEPTITQELMTLEIMIKDADNPRYKDEDYQFFKNSENFNLLLSVNEKGEIDPEIEEQSREEFLKNLERLSYQELQDTTVNDFYNYSRKEIMDISDRQSQIRETIINKMFDQRLKLRVDHEGKIVEDNPTGFLAIDIAKSLVSHVFSSRKSSVKYMKGEVLSDKLLAVPQWLRDGSLEQEQQIYKDEKNNFKPTTNFPLSQVSETWLKMQAIELDTRDGGLVKKALTGRNLTMLGYLAFGCAPLTLPLWGPALITSLGVFGVAVAPAAFTFLPIVGVASVLIGAPKILSSFVDKIRISFVQSRMDNLVKESYENGNLNVEEFKNYFRDLKNKENVVQRRDLLAHKNHEYRTAQMVYDSLKKINQYLPNDKKFDLNLNEDKREGLLRRILNGNKNKSENGFNPKNINELGSTIQKMNEKIALENTISEVKNKKTPGM